MTPEERAAKLAREICACTCHGTKPAPADNSGPLKDGSHYANCPAESDLYVLVEMTALIREAVKAEREASARVVETFAVQGIFDLRAKLAAAIRERPL